MLVIQKPIQHSQHWYCSTCCRKLPFLIVHLIFQSMSRSAADATRFTATSPHAYSKPSALRSAASNTFSPSSYPRTHPLPRNAKQQSPTLGGPAAKPPLSETAAQKVARLRAAHAMQKEAQISTWDRVVVRGRVIADAAHRFTALGLIGLTGTWPRCFVNQKTRRSVLMQLIHYSPGGRRGYLCSW